MERKAPAREKLDVPAVAPIEQKLANLTRQRPCIGPAPRSSVLGQLAAFLPQLALENERLRQQMQTRPAADFGIEHVEEGDSEAPYIEMDLACGVLELRDEAALRAAERAMEVPGEFLGAGGEASSSAGTSSEDDDDEGDDDAESSDEDSGAGRDGGGIASTRADEAAVAEPSAQQRRGEDGMECDGRGGAASRGPERGRTGSKLESAGTGGGVAAEPLGGGGGPEGGGGARRRVKVAKKKLVTMLS